MIILGALSIGAGLLLLTLPETKGAALPRTVDDMLKGNLHVYTNNLNACIHSQVMLIIHCLLQKHFD